MAKNIFSLFQGYVPKPKRNVFDLSFNNNFTTKFGQLTPVLCKEVIPGDSIKIDTAAGLRLMPMAFPVQTPMKAYVHYFYVRNRAIWKDWQDFITGTKKDLVPPYIAFGDSSQAVQKFNGSEDERKKEFFKVGGNADYFGIPVSVYGSESNSDVTTLNVGSVSNNVITDTSNVTVKYNPFTFHAWVDYNFLPYETWKARSGTTSLFTNDVTNITSIVNSLRDRVVGTTAFGAFTNSNPNLLPNPWDATKRLNTDVSSIDEVRFVPWQYLGRYDYRFVSLSQQITFSFSSSSSTSYQPVILVVRENSTGIIQSVFGSTYRVNTTDNVSSVSVPAPIIDEGYSVEIYTLFYFNGTVSNGSSNKSIDFHFALTDTSSIVVNIGANQSDVEISNIGDMDSTPFDSDIRLSALPFRAYECIYNSYYRNMQNNPYILNGETEYNKFVPSKEGGADYNYYPLHQRNWEYDFMTSAVPSPQFGIAPLVGITMTGAATFADEDGNTYYAQAELDSDGTITGWSTHSSNMPAGTLRMLMDSVGTGISINDLRNVNSFQRFLENSLRVGLKYRDQIKGHYGVEVRYDELDMPEFIGGMSLDVNVNQVTQTADVQDSSYPLAGFAGQGGAFGSSNHSVTKYCDEHGFIIGILSVVPVPVYSQLLPKFFLKNEQLDYFFPEFGHIGYQPILQKEVSPLQSFYTGGDLNKVFGYQRAWYDYIASTDEVHGQFRTTLRDFVMNRTFENEPLLNEDFLLVDPEQVNDVFLSTESGEYSPESDKILGQLYFKITKKSPIPKLGIPRLTD